MGKSACQPLPKKAVNRITKLAEQGLSKTAIAKVTGHSINSIGKYLDIDSLRRNDVAVFKDNLSQLLHEGLLSSMIVQAKVLTSLGNEDIDSLSFSEKRQLLQPINTVMGTIYDKIRLQDGKSTVNSSHRIQLESVHDTLYVDEAKGKQGHQVGHTKGKTYGIMETDGVESSQVVDNIEIIDQ